MSQKSEGAAESTTTASPALSGQSDEAALIQLLDQEETGDSTEAGQPAEGERNQTNLTQGSESGGSPEGETDAEGEEEGETGAEATGQDEGESESETEEEQEQPKSRVQKRIDALTAQNKDLKQRLQKAEAKESPEKSGTAKSGFYDPADEDEDLGRFRTEEAAAQGELNASKELRRALRDSPERGLQQLAGILKRPDLTAEQAADILDDHEEANREKLANAKASRKTRETEVRAQIERQRGAWDAIATRRFGWLDDESDSRSSEVQQLTEKHPWVARLPYGRAALAFLVETVREEHAKVAAAKAKPAAAADGKPNGQARVRPPGTSGNSGGSPKPVPKREERIRKADKRLQADPTDGEALSEFLESSLLG